MKLLILDVGCGRNPKNVNNAECIHIDVVKYDTVDLVADALHLPFKDCIFDEIIASEVVEHLDRPEVFFREAHRVLKPGGLLRVIVPIGLTAKIDPTHKHEWTWETPLFFTNSKKYHGFNIPFRIVYRRYNDAWFVPPLSKLSPLLRFFARRFGGLWLSGIPLSCGQMEILFCKEG